MNIDFTNEEIELIMNKIQSDNEFSLSKRQIVNIASKLHQYNISPKYDKLLLLEYSCRIKNEINNYIRFNVRNNIKKYFFNTIDYSIKRVLSLINGENNSNEINDSILENEILFIESQLMLELNNIKKLSLSIDKK